MASKLKEHALDPARNPLLVFPEGTCVNNRYILQFKKGVFDLEDVPVVPIAIRYTSIFVDPFWKSSEQSFVVHLFELMTSWCLIANVHFLEPTRRRPTESAEEFASRVRARIASKAELKPADFDGYMKHYQPSERMRGGSEGRAGRSAVKDGRGLGGRSVEELLPREVPREVEGGRCLNERATPQRRP